MRCPYHPHQTARFTVPGGRDDEVGWLGWLEGCCGLPAWRCGLGELHPVDAAWCTYHGCQRPPLSRVAHEVANGPSGGRDVAPPSLLVRSLEIPPNADGRSTPALAGNVLAYVSADGRVVAVDMGGERSVVMAERVDAAALKVVGGDIVGALHGPTGLRYPAWSIDDLRIALATDVPTLWGRATNAVAVHLLGLPRDRTRLHQGAGMMRLVVEHDPVPDEQADRYERITGVAPGEWLIRRTPNPEGPLVPQPDLRPQALDQVPVPVPGGVFLLGRLRWYGRTVSGALLVPTVAGYVAGLAASAAGGARG